jgi:glycosyltransferase involved in cell wall biosynthesis
MKVLQLIDSLEPGGAERIAVTYANSLCEYLEGSYLCATRAEGTLKDTLHCDVGYIFLKKKRTLDISALFRLKRFVKSNGIECIQAHTTSYFFATLLKLIHPKLKLIWHEHHGNRVQSKPSEHRSLVWCSKFFYKIIVVNPELKEWCKRHLATQAVEYIPNFVIFDDSSTDSGKRTNTICCVANLRDPKNHLLLLKAFRSIHPEHPNWKLELIGKDFNDSYSETIKNYITENKLEDHITLTGSLSSIEERLKDAFIGVLSSTSEGLPMALLEYGKARLYPITTDVGNCREVISTFGAVVKSGDERELADALSKAIENKEMRLQQSGLYFSHIKKHYSLEGVLPKLMKIYTG